MKTHSLKSLSTRPLLITLGLLAAPAFIAVGAPPPFVASQPPIFGGPGLSQQPRADFESSGQRQARGVNAPPQAYAAVGGVTLPPGFAATAAPGTGGGLAASTTELPEPIGYVLANGHVASAALGGETSLNGIRSATSDTNADVVADIDRRVEIAARVLDNIKTGRGDRVGAQSDLGMAIKDAEAREKELRGSLRSARRVAATEWAGANADLATEYEAYLRAVERVEVLASSSQVLEVK